MELTINERIHLYVLAAMVRCSGWRQTLQIET